MVGVSSCARYKSGRARSSDDSSKAEVAERRRSTIGRSNKTNDNSNEENSARFPMGIVYKVMKHRRGLEMDRVSRQREPQADVDRKFPAEYILQLCKFLAEKSKRNKQQQQMRVSNNHDASFEYEEVDETMETEAQKEAAAVEALALIKHSRLAAIPTPADTRITTTTSSLPPSPSSLPLLATTKPVLVDKVVNTRIQQQHHRPSTPSSCAAQFQRGHKQDILQKIRSQIFERKRQRQLATMQRIGAVWRPW